MALIDHVKAMSGDTRQKAHAFVTRLIDEMQAAVAASDIFKVRDLVNQMHDHRDDIAAHLASSSTAERSAPAGAGQHPVGAAQTGRTVSGSDIAKREMADATAGSAGAGAKGEDAKRQQTDRSAGR